jgi:hypothetical protein
MVAREKPTAVPVLMSPRAAEDFLGIGRTRLLKLAREGKLQVRRDVDNGRRYFVTESLIEYVRTMEERA